MSKRGRRLAIIAPLAVVGMLLFVFIGGELVKALWNWLLPPLFGWREVSFWQALALLALCRILFGGFGLHGSGRSGIRRRVRERMAERYDHLPPEERERFRQRMRERFGFGPSSDESAGR